MKPQHLPNASQAQVTREKVVDYLLCAEHPDGGSKARFFQHFGFSIDHWPALAEALRQHGLENKIVNAVESPFGCRYIVYCGRENNVAGWTESESAHGMDC